VIPRFTFFLSGSGTTRRDFLIEKDGNAIDFTPSTPREDYEYRSTDPYYQTGPDGLRIHPLDAIANGWLGYGFDNRWNAMLNLSYKLTPSMKMVLSGQINGRRGVPFDYGKRMGITQGMPQWYYDLMTWGYPTEEEVEAAATEGREIDLINGAIPQTGTLWCEEEMNHIIENNFRNAFVWTHQLNQSTFYSLRGSYYDYNRKMRSYRWVNDDGYMSHRMHYWPELNSAYDDTVWTPDDPMHLVELIYIPDERYNAHYGSTDSMDIVERTYGHWYYGQNGMGISRQGSGNYLTDHFDITRTFKGDVTSQVTTHHQVKAGFLYNHLTLDQMDNQYPAWPNPYIFAYVRHPWELGLYIQDKIEYDFMILNVGFRYDAAHAGEVPFWADPRRPINPATGNVVINPFLTEEEALEQGLEPPPLLTGELRSQLSPRLGVSHPVTDQSVIYFNYGHFFQNPVYRNLYLEGDLEDMVPLVGNPNMQNEKSISYEFGYKHQFTDIYAMEVTMWAKDTSNMVGSEQIPSFFQGVPNPHTYTVFLNYDYASSKGIDLALIRRYANYFSARANYSFMTTQSNRDDPWSGYREDHTLETSPKRPRVLGWDVPHQVSAQVSVALPEGAGPGSGSFRPLEMLNASLIYRASAGRPYTPRTKDMALEVNSGRRPWTFRWDMKVYRDFQIVGLRASLFADIRNLFDRKNVVQVFARTGKPDDPGPGESGYSDNYDLSYYYGTPRTINVGLRLYF
jgi:outer membrane receptor protein involved in Fe transport